MATFRKIHTIFWSDPFVQSLSPERKYFYLYLLTNEKTRQCGIYEISKGQISYDTGYNIDTVSILLKYFIEAKKIAYSLNTSEIAIKNWNKYNDNSSPKVQTLVKQELARVKNSLLIEYLYSTNTVCIPYRQEEEREVEKEREKEEDATYGSEPLCYDIKLFFEKNVEQFQVFCTVVRRPEKDVLDAILTFHLHYIEKGLYPRAITQLKAGLHKWILNEKKFSNGGNKSGNSKSSRQSSALDQMLNGINGSPESST